MPLSSQNLISEFLIAVPEFRLVFTELDSGWQDLTYVVFGHFSRYLAELLQEPKSNRVLLQRVFQFLEDMATSRDDDVQAVLMCGFLEVLGDDHEILGKAHNWMGEVTRRLSDETERFWGRS